jgi:4-hydroxy-2-oxoglutarate aldolase
VDAAPPRFAVLSGSAPGFYAAMCVGAVGGVIAAACVVPELCVRLHALTAAGQHTEARELQRILTPLAALITTTHGVPGLKAALDLAGYKGGDPRPPLMPLAAEARAQIGAALARLQEVA